MKKNIILAIASIGGIGFFPWASGTVASAATILPYFWLRNNLSIYIVVTILVIVIGVWISSRAEEILESKDPHAIVIDEVAGYLIAAIALPNHWFYPIAAFFIFRFFDVIKPMFINRLQSLPGGWGVMLDDVLAGIYTNIILQIVNYFYKF